jgi:hypothetical protein
MHAYTLQGTSSRDGTRAEASTETNDAHTHQRREARESAPSVSRLLNQLQPVQRSPSHEVRSSSSSPTRTAPRASASDCAPSTHNGSTRFRDSGIDGARVPRRFHGMGHINTPSQLLLTQITGTTTGDGLLELVWLRGKGFRPADASSALQQAARLSAHARVAPKVIRKLVEVALRLVQEMQPLQMADTLWALARLGHAEPAVITSMIDALVQVATPQLGSFKAPELDMTRMALSTLGHADTDFMRALQAAKPQR